MIALDFGLGGFEAEIWRVVFLMTRVGAALLAAPFFGASNVPVMVRVSFTGAMAIFISIWLPEIPTPEALLTLEGMLMLAGEALIGLTRDPCTGPMVTLAAGGVLAEVLGDAALRPAPVTAEAARAMTEEVRSFVPLRGYRGHATGDLGALAGAVAALSRLALHPRVQEAEINPVLIGAGGVLRLDALVRLGPSGDAAPHHPA